jgi:hypothetical protein
MNMSDLINDGLLDLPNPEVNESNSNVTIISVEVTFPQPNSTRGTVAK